MSDNTHTPPQLDSKQYSDPKQAVDYLIEIYDRNTKFLRTAFNQYVTNTAKAGRFRAHYPEIRFTNSTYARADSRWSYGHVDEPGTYTTTITQPRLFKGYLRHQLQVLLKNHGGSIEIGESTIPIPLHFALSTSDPIAPGAGTTDMGAQLRDVFDVPDIAHRR